MYVRGYVKNIPGAPMCACAEQMPTVSRADCTQIDFESKFPWPRTKPWKRENLPSC